MSSKAPTAKELKRLLSLALGEEQRLQKEVDTYRTERNTLMAEKRKKSAGITKDKIAAAERELNKAYKARKKAADWVLELWEDLENKREDGESSELTSLASHSSSPSNQPESAVPVPMVPSQEFNSPNGSGVVQGTDVNEPMPPAMKDGAGVTPVETTSAKSPRRGNIPTDGDSRKSVDADTAAKRGTDPEKDQRSAEVAEDGSNDPSTDDSNSMGNNGESDGSGLDEGANGNHSSEGGDDDEGADRDGDDEGEEDEDGEDDEDNSMKESRRKSTKHARKTSESDSEEDPKKKAKTKSQTAKGTVAVTTLDRPRTMALRSKEVTMKDLDALYSMDHPSEDEAQEKRAKARKVANNKEADEKKRKKAADAKLKEEEYSDTAWQRLSDFERKKHHDEGIMAINKVMKGQGKTHFPPTIVKRIHTIQAYLPEAACTSRLVACEALRTSRVNITCIHHQYKDKRTDKGRHIQDGKEGAKFKLMGVPGARLVSKSKNSVQPPEGLLHCGCVEEEVLMDFFLWKTVLGEITREVNGVEISEGMGEGVFDPRHRMFVFEMMEEATGLTLDDIYTGNLDTATTPAYHRSLLRLQYRYICNKLKHAGYGMDQLAQDVLDWDAEEEEEEDSDYMYPGPVDDDRSDSDDSELMDEVVDEDEDSMDLGIDQKEDGVDGEKQGPTVGGDN